MDNDKAAGRAPGVGEHRALLARLSALRPTDALRSSALAVNLLIAEGELRTGRLEGAARRRGITFLSMPGDVGESPEQSGSVVLNDNEMRWLANARRVLKRWPLDRTCLRRSLILGWILRRRNPELVIGVRRQGDSIHAHAWVRVSGIDLDADAASFERYI